MKVFRVTGEIHKPNFRTPFRKELIADKAEHAVERVYTELGSKHRVKRFHIRVDSVSEVQPNEIENPLLKKLAMGEDKVE